MADLETFKKQIGEDISLIQEDFLPADSHLQQPEYAFNYWILSRLFSIDEALIPELVTDYSDKGIDCFVHYEENKELYIIQNKYYSESKVSRPDVSDFLKSPLSILGENKYKKSPELQNAFNKAKDDPDYKLFFYFFTTDDKESNDICSLINNFNNSDHGLQCYVNAEFFALQDIYDRYYGKNYKEDVRFEFPLATLSKGTFASLREEYGIENMYEAYYIVTPVSTLYEMLKDAEKKGYPIFEENMREFLGPNPVNNGIIATLKSPEERNNFMYYNNGVTIICEQINTSHIDISSNRRVIPLVNPQIVNGCQTVNSIRKVLENLSDNEITEYESVYVMVKALVIEDKDDPKNKAFYENVVHYTNKQNAIPDKVFAAKSDIFERIKAEFNERGFSLLVKPSDKYSLRENLSKKQQADLVQKANSTINTFDHLAEAFKDTMIPLDKLLQVYIALLESGFYAFTKKNQLLKTGSELYEEYSLRIQDYLTSDNMIRLYWLYHIAEEEQKKSDDQRTPIPYYVIGFLGSLIGEKTPKNIQAKLDYIFGDPDILKEAYSYLVAVSKNYKDLYESTHEQGDYNTMIKKPIDEKIEKLAISTAGNSCKSVSINNWAVKK